MLTTQPARILRIPDHGVTVGSRADLVVWEADRAEQVVSALSPCRLVVKTGRVATEHIRSVVEPWRGVT
jgi:imidazolonepropionase-like amidohydrolase